MDGILALNILIKKSVVCLRNHGNEKNHDTEVGGSRVFNQGVSAKIDDMDPHGINGFGEDNKIAPRTTDGVNVSPADSNDNYKVVYWEGWYDIDDDGAKKNLLKLISLVVNYY